MKNAFLIIAVIFTVFVSIAVAQEEQQEMSPEQTTWMEYMTPSWGHELLAANVGEWEGEMTYWPAPDAEPMISNGTSVVEMILGGRYSRSTQKFDAMGMEMNGISTDAFDNGKQEFINVWIDNFGTGVMVSHGNYDEKSKTITYTGSAYDPAYGMEMPYRQIYHYIDGNNNYFEMYMTVDGKEYKSMEVRYKRK
ncbi:MAG: hypothetical protein A2V66_10010 [Ignavibacteria bacterium RBG_13_36_8]|nr:MAG: hypothetical protein A2V66_10010 [Ignavibacteria bacterium RBG_13_36_8]